MDASVKLMTERNEKQLDAIRGVVDEKNCRRRSQSKSPKTSSLLMNVLNRSIRGSEKCRRLQAEWVILKRFFSNVKTRGTLGEIQLGAILGEVLAPEQYECNFDAGKQNNERVEFAIKLPNDGGEAVYLPVDSKFPADIYSKLCDAYDSGEDVAAAQKKTCVKFF